MQPKKQPMRKKQISTIWAIAKTLGINSEYLHVLVWGITGSESISALSDKQLTLVIDHLKKEQAKQNQINKKQESSEKVFQLPTPAQRYKLHYVIADLRKILNLRDSNAYLQSISKKMFDRAFEKLNRKEFGNLLKQLISITNKTKIAK
jgi:hypothetical protein